MLDSVDDHVTQVECNRKHFKKQRKPYLCKFAKKPRDSLLFGHSQAAHAHSHRAINETVNEAATFISPDKFQGEIDVE